MGFFVKIEREILKTFFLCCGCVITQKEGKFTKLNWNPTPYPPPPPPPPPHLYLVIGKYHSMIKDS